ncbi:phage portal protein, partial [Zhenhengia sp.]|uniref:phage portal protein n=1 Tax=Zhenhengia sp. TaxID=2944208 RepID=UPI00307A1C32
MFKYKMPKGTEMTPKLIESLMESHKAEKTRVMQLFEYYENHNSILNRKMKDSDKPNNKLPHPYAAYITNLATGYFVGEPITYTVEADEQAQKFYDELQSINKYNDEPKHNATLAKYASIAGYSFELLYTDTNKKTRYKAIKPYEVIYIVDSTLEEAPLYAIRYYNLKDFITGQDKLHIEVYSQTDISYYIREDEKEGLQVERDTVAHNYHDVPVSIYENNEEGIGDFEKVIHLINAYDQSQSDTANDFEYFTDAYLAFYGTNGLSNDNDDDNVNMKENRMLFFQESGSKGEWLIKNINDTATENYKNRLDRDIHKFSMVPPMTDENFAGNVSGEAMK